MPQELDYNNILYWFAELVGDDEILFKIGKGTEEWFNFSLKTEKVPASVVCRRFCEHIRDKQEKVGYDVIICVDGDDETSVSFYTHYKSVHDFKQQWLELCSEFFFYLNILNINY